MKKLYYLLASTISTFGALASAAGTARTSVPDLWADASTFSEVDSSANPITVSESAKLQIGSQALEGKTLLAAQKVAAVKGAVETPKFMDNFRDMFLSGAKKKTLNRPK